MKLIQKPFQYLFLLFLLVLSSASLAQSTDEQMALDFMSDHDYDKAAIIYERLYNKDPQQNIYTNYLECLTELKEFDKAEKVIKKEIKRNPDNPTFVVDLGYLYKEQNETDKANLQYDKAVKSLPANQVIINTVANSFYGKHETDFALQTYLQGKKLLKNIYAFHFEIAEIYFAKNDLPKMLDEYLDYIDENPAYIKNVEGTLQTKFANDPSGEKYDLLRTTLLRRIQKNADKIVYSDMLIWMFEQQKDFDGALVQAKALDKRFKEDGSRIIDLATVAVSNSDFNVAVKAYQYVISKGNDSPYYITARVELLNALSKKITKDDNYTQKDLTDLEKDYYMALNELGKNTSTASLLKGMAHFEAFYLNKIDTAKTLLQEVVDMPGLNSLFIGECKLELGDILLFKGDIWESTLLYSQVSLDLKQSPLGQDAKFRNAKWYFYKGDFTYAQAMLDILKASTSDLISNDAIDMSLLISDNMGPDSTNDELTLYAQADLLLYQNKVDEASVIMDTLMKDYPEHSIIMYVFYEKSKILKKKGKIPEAMEYLQKIVDKYSDGVLADDALFDLGDITENRLKDPKKAMSLYQQLILKYPNSLYTTEARKRYRALRGDIVN